MRIGSTLLWVIVLAAAAAAASLFPAPFLLDREAFEGGQDWRLFTGHLVHGTWQHFLFDVGAAALLLLFLRPRRFLLWLLLLPPFVGLGVLALHPDMTSYGGLSGVLHGLMVVVAVDLIRRWDGAERALACLALVATLGKALYEGLSGQSVFTDGIPMGGVTVHTAHLLGAIGGLAVALGERVHRHLQRVARYSELRASRVWVPAPTHARGAYGAETTPVPVAACLADECGCVGLPVRVAAAGRARAHSGAA